MSICILVYKCSSLRGGVSNKQTPYLTLEMPLLYSALLIAPFLLFAAQAAYNLFFHPLRTYPGPLATRASKWPWFYQKLRGAQVAWVTDLHRRYGDVVRVAPNQLSYIKGEAWKDIYGHRTSNGRGNIPKHKEAYPPPAVGTTSILT
ncbi:Cytochrome P450 [Macrophomina phaseolina MS6]|uniref:Cytochrome P450 n=1 Tax=Macrophomina phaseolina (strain MS6) TaxID=1126212 RepID=K2RPQ8_MACPH|nr:Cytochrome P450 [Macrophomina phaseolina MS6]